MNINLHLALLILAVFFFLLEALGAQIPRINKTAVGLFFFALSFIF